MKRWLLTKFCFLLFASTLASNISFGQVTDTFNASGTFTVPPGVFSVTVEAWGGGGGGSIPNRAGGGGGGAYAKKNTLAVTAGQVYTVTVGAGGSGGTNASGTVDNSTSGGTSTFGLQGSGIDLVRAVGGTKGALSVGGAGGLASDSRGDVLFSGGRGADGAASSGGGGGAGARSTANGAPAVGAAGGGAVGSAGKGGDSSSTIPAEAVSFGAAPGGGGGGANNAKDSGPGAAGRVVITYTVPTPPSLGGVGATQNYTERVTGQLLLAPTATLTDSDSANFGGGSLRVQISGASIVSDEDRIYIQQINNITLVNDQYVVNNSVFESIKVYHTGVLIGEISASNNGARGNALQVDLNSNATPAVANDLLKSIYYQNVDNDNAVAGTRALTITLNDGSGATTTANQNIVVVAEVFSITSPSTGWTRILNGVAYDPSEDQQANSGPDLVGTLNTPLLVAKYDDKGTPSTADDTVNFRLRVDDSARVANYIGYIFIGYDFELDGDIDAFISLEGTSKGTKTYVYAATDANISPATTGLGTRYLIPNYNTLTSSNYSTVGTIDGLGDVAASTYAGSDAEIDYYQTFQINFADLASVLNPVPLNNYYPSASGHTTVGQLLNTDLRSGFTEDTPFRFIIGTATQSNSINSDFGGVGRLGRTGLNTSWDALGVFGDPISFGNIPPLIRTGNGDTATYFVPESTTPVATVSADDANADFLTYSLLTGGSYGADGALFRIDPVTGALRFILPPDYENPTDANVDNVYLVTVQVDDGKGGLDTQLVYVYILNEPEGSNPAPTITSNGGGTSASFTVAENTASVTTVTALDEGDYIGAADTPAIQAYSINPASPDFSVFDIDASTGVVTFRAAPDFEMPGDAGGNNVYNITVVVTDGGAPLKTDSQDLVITVSDVFEAVAPVMAAMTYNFPGITEDETSNTGKLVSEVLAGMITSSRPGSTVGMALTGFSATNGKWQYSLDAGGNWIDVGTRATYDLVEDDFGVITVVATFTSAGAMSDANALLLDVGNRIRFLPNAENGGGGSVTFRAWDEESRFIGDYVDVSVNGGATPYSSTSNTASIISTDLNDAPVVSGGPVALATIKDHQTSAVVTVASLLANVAVNYSDVDTGHVTGAAVVGKTGAGNWQYSADGVSWVSFGALSDSTAFLLSPLYRLRYVPSYPVAIAGETAQLTIRGWDQTTGTIANSAVSSTNGGTTAFSSGSFLVQILVEKDDRPLVVSSPTVNEASPWAVFSVTGAAGQQLQLALNETVGVGFADVDQTQPLQYWNGSAWVNYTAGALVTIPAGGVLLVRVNITLESDTAEEGLETFQLVATNTGGTPYSGTGTIADDGTGVIYPNVSPTDPSTPVITTDNLDDDRTLTVSSPTVNEASPWVVFTLGSSAGNKQVRLSLIEGSGVGFANINETQTLQYWDPVGLAWLNYTAGATVSVSGTTGLLVRVNITQESDTVLDGPETFQLSAALNSGAPRTGTATIVDNGTGVIYPDLAPTDPTTPATRTDNLDDDRPLAVSSPSINEASPWAVFSVTGVADQKVTLSLTEGSGAGAADVDQTQPLEYWNGSAWVDYTPGAAVTIPAGGVLLVRVDITQESDTNNEGAETFQLLATNTGGTSYAGTGTIVDDGTGVRYPDLPPTNSTTPASSTDNLDDDRPVTVSSPTVNEGSPWAVFSLTGAAGQQVTLSLNEGSGAGFANVNETQPLQYWNGSAWVNYTPGALVTIPAGGVLLVRVDISQESDLVLEGLETFQLGVTNTGGTSYSGTGTIADNGTGVIYPDSPPTNPGTPAFNRDNLDDDRPLSVVGVTVNESSPWAVFLVSSRDGTFNVTLSLTEGSGLGFADVDQTQPLQFWNGSAWVNYTPGASVTIPSGSGVLVRVDIRQESDLVFDGPETFQLVATDTNTDEYGGTGTIVDDGTGLKYPDLPPTNATTPASNTNNLDDDRPVAVSSPAINEASPWAVFSVTGVAGQQVTLSLTEGSGAGFANVDQTQPLQFWNGSAWVDYTPGSLVTIPAGGVLLVRVDIRAESDLILDGPETFQLFVTNTGGTSFSGTGTIVDDGTGVRYPDLPPTNPTTPATSTANLDDDRVLTVSSPTINEASPWAVFSVTGVAGQQLTLSLTEGSGAGFANVDQTQPLEYWNGSAWVDYTPGALVTIPAGGVLLVRVDILQESETSSEGPETFQLLATNTGGTSYPGTGTIVDNGSGVIYPNLPPTGPGAPATSTDNLDDDRVLAVSSPRTNEASPWAVFSVTGVAGQQVTLSLSETIGVGFADVDQTQPLQYWNGSAWVNYTPGALVTIPAGGVLLVRVNIVQEDDTTDEGPETFQLVATNRSGIPFSGTGTIADDGSGVIYPDLPPTNPSTPVISTDNLDEDRPLSVNSVTVNESSPWAVFSVRSGNGLKRVTLTLVEGSGAGFANIDETQPLQYWDSVNLAWTNYTPGVVLDLPARAVQLVRVNITQESDILFDGPETFLLVATDNQSNALQGIGTIVDDGSGLKYPDQAPTNSSTPVISTNNLDDDRPLVVTGPTVNEASPWAVFSVAGGAGQQVTLSLNEGRGAGFANVDEAQPLEYWDGSAWVDYTPGALVTIPAGGVLLVRVDILQESDAIAERAETFQLVATNTGGAPYSGTGTIVDDGTGDYWIADSTTPATLQQLVDAAIVLDHDQLRDATIKWGIANADPFNGLMDATIIANDTSSPVVYAGMEQGQFDLHMTVAGLANNGLKMLGGEASWYMSPKTSLSTTTFRFYEPGTTTPQLLQNIHFSIEDAEFGEELSNFSYWDANGTKVSLPWSDTAFTYSATPLFRSNGTVVENGSNFENDTQSGKSIRIDLRGVLISGLEFNFRKRVSTAGAIVLTHLTGNPGKLGFGGIFSPLTVKANAAGLGAMPDYRTQTTRQAGVVGTVTQDPAPGTLLPVGNHDVKLTLTTADDSANIGFDMTIRARRPSVVAITGPVAGSVSITGDAALLPLTGTVRDWEGEGIAAVEVTYGGQTLSATVGTPNSFGISTWSLPITPVNGTNSFSVSAVDVNGIRSLTATRTFDFTRRYSFAVTANPTAGTVKPTSTHSTSTRSLSLLSTVGATNTYSVLPTANISLTAKALVGYVFSHWSGIPAGATAVPGSMRLVMPAADIAGVEAHFVATPFTTPAGTSNTFYGLLKPVDVANTSNDSVAMLTGTLVPKSGTFSGSIALGGLTHRFTCTFAGNGTSWFSLDHAAPANSLTLPGGHVLDLSFDTINGIVIAALSKGGVTSQGVIQRGIYTSTNPVPQNLLNLRAPSTLVQNNLGFYTAAIPTKTQAPARTPSSYPQGDGFTTITLLNTGTLTLSGVLADGSTITASTALVTGDVSPFFAQLTTPGATTKDGSFSGSLNFVPGTDSDVTGTDLLWVRPTVIDGNRHPNVATQLYTEGWPSGIRVDLVGAFYDTAVNVQTGLGLPSPDNTLGNGELNFSLGKLVSDVSVTAFNITANTVAKLQPKDRTFQLSVNGPRATFNGTFTPNWTPRLHALPAFRGILLQKGADGPAGYGFFLSNRGTDLDPESGRATLGAPN